MTTSWRPVKAGAPLTPREHQAMWLVAEGLSTKEMADRMCISYHTTKFHMSRAFRKLGTTSRTLAAVRFALKQETARERFLP